jgi:hypothetical protein
MTQGYIEVKQTKTNGAGEVIKEWTVNEPYICSRKYAIIQKMDKCEACGNRIGQDDLVYIDAYNVFCSFHCLREYNRSRE